MYPPTLNSVTVAEWIAYRKSLVLFCQNMDEATRKMMFLLSGVNSSLLSFSDMPCMDNPKFSSSYLLDIMEQRMIGRILETLALPISYCNYRIIKWLIDNE